MFNALVIEDDNTVRLILMELLQKKFGLATYSAVNGIEGLKILHENDIDIIFLDLTLPFMNGKELLLTIRKEPKYGDIPVFAISSHKDKETIHEVIDLGICDYILKPIDTELTLQRINNALTRLKLGK